MILPSRTRAALRSVARSARRVARPIALPIAAIAAVAATAAHPSAGAAQGMVAVVIHTTQGVIRLEIDSARAPVTAQNFLHYVDAHFYDGGRFVRTVRADNQASDPVHIAVVQAVGDSAREGEQLPPIPLERTTVTGLHHRDGTISMARNVPGSARSSFFICVGDQPSLDFGGARNPDHQGFAAFGRVVVGMRVVRAIWSSHAEGQRLVPPIRIIRIARAPTTASR